MATDVRFYSRNVVETLSRSAEIVGASLGDQHSVFLDAQGGVHSCGENKEGQCGVGSELEALALQHRQQLEQPDPRCPNQVRPGQLSTPQEVRRSSNLSSINKDHGAVAPRGPTEQAYMDQLFGARRRRGEAMGGGKGLLSEKVVEVAASRYFTVMRTSTGSVWTCGAGFSGELGHSTTWSPAPSQVEDELYDALMDGGGACKVVAGSTFAAAVTNDSRRALVWGRLGAHSHEGSVTTVDLPESVRVTDIAASRMHILVTDGESVWTVGRGALGTGSGSEDLQSEAPCSSPQLVALRPPGGVSRVFAGGHVSAVLDGQGSLWLWGMPSTSQSGLSVRPIPTRVETIQRIVTNVAIGGQHILVLTAD
eukprot:CAMPEP_0114228568 /NCGR_PEP_ID=MMETSP0058-20121206/2418_1 /TAXON_ID=36894 /ORGANISM="Pyramimonas parkeae, CCMP726" /LENGTH=365 /DNA_ID=CAMNT_0001339535 /DNA_START=279 /DNA_END=1376 /DNA_ORIENTATION=-